MKAARAAGDADVALVFVGADEQVSIEGRDRQSIDLPGAQHELVSAVSAANPRTVLVISSNSPVAVEHGGQDKLPAIVGGHFLGQEQGRALAEVLFGEYNPGGKLSTTWYATTEDLPDFHDYTLMHGRTYMYFKGTPLFPFGHGLSYTTFQYSSLELGAKALKQGETLTVSLKVTNTGARAGDEVVQLYVQSSAHTDNVALPVKQLVNFARVRLNAGETRAVTFELPHGERSLRYWNESADAFTPLKGNWNVLAGSSSEDIRLSASVELS
jgi:beta-glucosidase